MATSEYNQTDYHAFKDVLEGATEYVAHWSDNIQDLDERVVKRGTLSNRPAAAKFGRVYIATDEPAIYLDDGNQWVKIAGTDQSGETLTVDEIHASGGSATDPSYTFQNDTDTGFYSPAAGVLRAATQGVVALDIDANQNVDVPNGTLSEGGARVLSNPMGDDTHLLFGTAEDFGLVYDATAGEFQGVIDPNGTSPTDWIQVGAGGVVTFPASDIVAGTTTIWDAANAHIPEVALAKTYAALAENETVSGSWTFNPGLTVGGDVVDDATSPVTYIDRTNQWIPTAALEANSVTVAGNTVVLGGSTGVAYGDLSDTTSLPIPAGDLDLGDGLEDDGTGSTKTSEPVSFDPGHTEWEAGLSDEEIWRMNLVAGETFVVDRIEFRQKGGGSSTSVDIDVVDSPDATTPTVIGSTTLGSTSKNPGSSATGSNVAVRVTNGLTTAVNAAPRVVGRITGA